MCGPDTQYTLTHVMDYNGEGLDRVHTNRNMRAWELLKGW